MKLTLTKEQEIAIEELQIKWKEVGEPQPYIGVPGPVVVLVIGESGISMYIVIETDGHCHS